MPFQSSLRERHCIHIIVNAESTKRILLNSLQKPEVITGVNDMSADMIVDQLALRGILKRSAMLKSKPNLDPHDDDQDEKTLTDGKVSKRMK